MFESYLFVPANNKRFLKKTITLSNLNYRIFDLEDSVFQSELNIAINNLFDVNINHFDWARIPININRSNIIKKLTELGINNYVIPKFKGYNDFQKIYFDIKSVNQKAKMMLLIENAKSYIELEKIIRKFNESIKGICLGIHDFAFETGMKNEYMLLRNIRTNIMLIAKAYAIDPIDLVSLELKDTKKIKEEIIEAFNLGYRAKLLIHPNQLDILNSIEFYSLEDIREYKAIYYYFKDKVEGKKPLFCYNKRVYEKMHMENIKNIINWGDSFYGTNR